MTGWNRTANEWIANGCTTYVFLDTAHDSGTFDPNRPYVVATVDGGHPTGNRGEYERFRLLRNALSCARFRHDETVRSV